MSKCIKFQRHWYKLFIMLKTFPSLITNLIHFLGFRSFTYLINIHCEYMKHHNKCWWQSKEKHRYFINMWYYIYLCYINYIYFIITGLINIDFTRISTIKRNISLIYWINRSHHFYPSTFYKVDLNICIKSL